MSTMYINGTVVHLSCMSLDSYTVLQQCEIARLDIPRFCYHDQLSIAGNCRVCVVEIDNATKPILACATEVLENMSVVTTSTLVKQAREHVLEFLLINHPLDCPICDQGGECDLQDICRDFGGDTTRYRFDKRSVTDKLFGALIKTTMTRCIHCTRCVRFFDEIAGLPSIGTVGRGNTTELSSYFEYLSTFPTEITGNVIDLCPVGALTSKPYAFIGRPWELVSTESLDILDSLCSNIRIDTRGSEIMRVLPRLNYLVNNEWITDKIRFSINGLQLLRFFSPVYAFGGIGYDTGIWPHSCSWEYAFRIFRTKFLLLKHQAYFFAGNLLDCGSFFFFRFFCNSFGISNINVHVSTDSDLRLSYLLSNSLSLLFNDSNVYLLLGLNLKLESPILNIRLKNCSFANQSSIRIGYIGTHVFSNYPVIHLGFCSTAVSFFFFGRSFFSYDLQNVVCLTGRSISSVYRNLLLNISSSMFSTNYISLYSGDVNMHELCALQSFNSRSLFTSKSKLSFLYLLGADFLRHLYKAHGTFLVYHGHHLDWYDMAFDHLDFMLLPSPTFVERGGLFVNCQGRCQVAGQAVAPAGDAVSNERTLYSIYKYILDEAEGEHEFTEFSSLLKRILPYRVNYVSSFDVCSFIQAQRAQYCYIIYSTVFYIQLRNFYETDLISRSNPDFYDINCAYNPVHNYA